MKHDQYQRLMKAGYQVIHLKNEALCFEQQQATLTTKLLHATCAEVIPLAVVLPVVGGFGWSLEAFHAPPLRIFQHRPECLCNNSEDS